MCPLRRYAAGTSFSPRYYFRLDLTSDNKFSVSDYSKNLLNEADEVLTITYYRSSVLNSLYPQVKDVNDFLKEYSNNGKIFYKVVEPEKNNNISVLGCRCDRTLS